MTSATSPCIGYCRLDPATGLCLGCGRSGAEIASWRDASPDFFGRVWSALPARRARLGIALHRLPWTLDALADFVARSLEGGGTWSMGGFGPASTFRVVPGEACERSANGSSHVVARTPHAAVRFDLNDQVRVLSRAGAGDDPERSPIALAMPRVRPRPAAGLSALGLDRDAIDPGDRDARLYDLGLPSRESTLGLRTRDPELVRCLDDCLGLPWPDLAAGLGSRLERVAPTWVVLGPIGRFETSGEIALTSSTPTATAFEVPGGLESLIPCAWYIPDADRSDEP